MLNADSKPSLKYDAIKEGLRKHGYYVWRQPISDQEHRDLATKFGKIFVETEIKVDPTSERYYLRPDAFFWHTDHPSATVVSMQCIRADQGGNAPTHMIDMIDFQSSFTEAELSEMEKIRMKAVGKGEINNFTVPLLTRKEDGSFGFYYMPHELQGPLDPERTRVLEKFADFLSKKALDSIIEVSMREGEVFFMDNKRMIHGRYALQSTSVRHLRRFWIGPE
jgi:alpha-ketoglutarate-dependent taurine dioxygenase